jgi:redox-sensitive bicupin YhaK (pirin superfamily)
VFDDSSDQTEIVLRSEQAGDVLILAGEPIGEPVVQYGPFVMNTEEEIHQAIEDYRNGRMGYLDS